jgi:hypothetical protein
MSIKYIYGQTFAGTPYLCELSTERLGMLNYIDHIKAATKFHPRPWKYLMWT